MADEEDKKKKPKAKAKPKKKPKAKKKPKKKESKDLTDKQKAAGFGGKELQGIARLAVVVKEINLKAEGKKTDKERLDKLDELIKATKFGDKEGRQTLESLKSEFLASQERLRLARETGDEKLIAIEEENQERVASASSDVEKTREAEKATKKQSKLLEGIKSGIGNLANKFKDKAGFLAGLAGTFLAIFDPEKLQSIIDSIISKLIIVFDIIEKIISGDFKGALEAFGANWDELKPLVIFLAIWNAGKIIALGKGLIKGLGLLKTGIGGIAAFFGVGVGPLALAIAAITLVIAAAKKTFDKVTSVFEDTGSLFEAFKAGVIEFPAQLLGLPLNLIKSAVSWVLGIFGFDTAAMDEFDFVDELRKVYTKMFESVQMAVGWIKDKFTAAWGKGVEIFNGITDSIIGVWTSLKDGVKGAVNYVKELFNNAFTFIPEIFDSLTGKLRSTFNFIAEKFSALKTFIKAIGAAAWAATKAAIPGGESPVQAYKRVYREVMSSGSYSESTDFSVDIGRSPRRSMNISPRSLSGDDLNAGSIINTAQSNVSPQSSSPVIVNNVDNSVNNKSSSTLVSGYRKYRNFAETLTEKAFG
jgi:hypothetical protein